MPHPTGLTVWVNGKSEHKKRVVHVQHSEINGYTMDVKFGYHDTTQFMDVRLMDFKVWGLLAPYASITSLVGNSEWNVEHEFQVTFDLSELRRDYPDDNDFNWMVGGTQLFMNFWFEHPQIMDDYIGAQMAPCNFPVGVIVPPVKPNGDSLSPLEPEL
jgi:hypothetical protein